MKVKKIQLYGFCLIAFLAFAGLVQAEPIRWDVSAAGAPAFGDTDTLTGVFNQITFFAQTSTMQFDTDGDGVVSLGDEFSDDGDLRVSGLLANSAVDEEGLGLLFEVTARWTEVSGVVTGVELDPSTGDTRIDIAYTGGTIYMFLDTSLNSTFANPAGSSPPAGAGGTGFNDGTLVATFQIKDGIGHTFLDFSGGDLQNQGSVDLALEFTDALEGFWYSANSMEALDPVGSGLTVLLDMNIDHTTQVPGTGDLLYTAHSNEDGSILVETGCINLEKEVSVDGRELFDPAKQWFDADVWEDAPTTGLAATYRLIVENCGDILLTGVTLNDVMPSSTDPETIVFENVLIGDLEPGERKVIVAGYIADLDSEGNVSNIESISGFEGLDAPYRCLDDWKSVEGAPEGLYLNTARVTTNENYTDQDPAWVSCRMQEGACRMTGGSVTLNNFFAPDGDPGIFYNYVDETYGDASDVKLAGKSGKMVSDSGTWVTTGGQIGAPSTDPATGHWTHTQHAGQEGIFTFLAGTASAPSGTEISNIACDDPGWCVQARCAPFKQIFWDGVGYFPNKHGGDDFDASFPSASCEVVPGGPSRDGTLHYFRAMVGDFGENDRKNRQIDANDCEWTTTTGGPSGFDVSEVVYLDAVVDDKFGDRGGQECDKCPDYYQIEIYCGGSEAEKGQVIYTFADFIDGGNFQIHPETSEQCTPDLFE